MTQPRAGDALGASYRLAERIGSGAAGDVWRAESTAEGTSFAAKILKPEHASDPALVERFIRERSVLIGLRHPSIVAVRDLVVEGSTLAIVMDLVPGGSLRDLLAAHGPLPASEALTLCAQVFGALSAAHERGIAHRDIKPDNVLLTEADASDREDTVRVSDFGIASVVHERNRQTAGLLGTPQYMAPELISHGQTTPAADIYSAGVMLYELLSGRTPFAGPGTDFTIAYRHVTSAPPRLDLPEKLWAALAAVLAKDPRERPSATEAEAGMRRLAAQFAGLAPLEAASPVEAFDEIERPATVLRSDLIHEAETPSDYVSPLTLDAPELGDTGQQTMLRSLPRRESPVIPVAPEAPEAAIGRAAWLTKKTLVLGGLGIALLAGLIVGMAVIFGGGGAEDKASASAALQASQQDTALPTGLTVSRQAAYDPASKEVSLTLKYTAQRASLTGEFFETVPGIGDNAACPPVVWEGVEGTRHQAASTGLTAKCGWKLVGVEIPPKGQVSITATFPATITDAAELEKWLTGAAAATSEALNDPSSSSSAYPVQRLRDITVVTPSRTVSQTPLPVTLLPVWPGGADELNPLYRSPASGAPTQLLKDIAGGESGVRFSDSCSGTVSISSDGLVVTALSVTSGCRLRATVGNFTDLESSPFSITTRE